MGVTGWLCPLAQRRTKPWVRPWQATSLHPATPPWARKSFNKKWYRWTGGWGGGLSKKCTGFSTLRHLTSLQLPWLMPRHAMPPHPTPPHLAIPQKCLCSCPNFPGCSIAEKIHKLLVTILQATSSLWSPCCLSLSSDSRGNWTVKKREAVYLEKPGDTVVVEVKESLAL